jgi:DNA (cytosine-5)-methyltransferase 1
VFTDKYKRLAWNELCRSITAHISKDGYWYIHPDQHRTLSVREAARIQSFPDDFRFAGTQTHRYRQIGNAVPVLLGEAIGRAMKLALNQPRSRDAETGDDAGGFRDLLMDWHASAGITSPSWRMSGDPWQVLLAELLLVRAPRHVAERAAAALRSIAPSPAALLEHEDPEQALNTIGIRERATLAVKIATDLVEYFDGRVPEDETMLRLLPGVGDYLFRSVLSFGFGRRQVLVDRTTSRVASRVVTHADERRFQLRLDLHRLAGAPGADPAFNRALLDLGREICKPDVPLCGRCPVASLCATGRGTTQQLTLASAALGEMAA